MAIKGSGDTLARGAARASYGMPNVSQEKWDQIFGPKEEFEKPTVNAQKENK